MLLLTIQDTIVSHYEDNKVIYPDTSKGEMLLQADISPYVLEISGMFHWKKLSDVFTLDQLKLMYVYAIKVHTGNIITTTYPSFKQTNINRLASPYTVADQTTMHNFIDTQRNICTIKENVINAFTTINDLLSYNIYN